MSLRKQTYSNLGKEIMFEITRCWTSSARGLSGRHVERVPPKFKIDYNQMTQDPLDIDIVQHDATMQYADNLSPGK